MTENVQQPDKESEPVILQTLLRGLAVLDIIARSEGEASAKRIGAELGLRPATCYHILRTLVSERYITRKPSGTYDVGPQGGRLGNHLERQFGPDADLSAVLMRLRNQTKETAYLAGWKHGTMVILQFIGGSGPVAVGNLDVGYGANMHARASCLAVLAFLPPELVQTMLHGTEFQQLTPNTISSYQELSRRLESVRRIGYAVDHEEYVDGVCCVSAPFFGADGRPAGSFTVSATTSRFSSRRSTFASAVLEAAALATKLGAGTAPGDDRSEAAEA